MEEKIRWSLPLLATVLMISPLRAANAQTPPRIPVQSYTWLTTPASQYPDPQNNLLTDRKPANAVVLVNGGWAGRLDSARVRFQFDAPKTIDFFSIQILDKSEASIKTPDKVVFTCINNSPIPPPPVEIQIAPRFVEGGAAKQGAFEIGNPTKLALECTAVELEVSVGSGYWVFLGEVSFFKAQDVKQAKSLFLQLYSAGTEANLRAWLEKAADDPTIQNLTVTGAAQIDLHTNTVTLRTNKLDVVAEYFSRFDNVFIGFLSLQDITCQPYDSGILSEEVRWRNINGSRTALNLFRTRYPNLNFHYYLDYEADLNAFEGRPDILEANLAMNLELINDFRALRPDGATLWSPTFWTPYSKLADSTQLQAALTYYFSRLKQGTNGVGVQWLDFQDFVGQSYSKAAPMTYEDVKNYRDLLARSHNFASLRVNMEMFGANPQGGLHTMPGFELASRQAFYAENNLALGMAWEIRYWYDSEARW